MHSSAQSSQMVRHLLSWNVTSKSVNRYLAEWIESDSVNVVALLLGHGRRYVIAMQ